MLQAAKQQAGGGQPESSAATASAQRARLSFDSVTAGTRIMQDIAAKIADLHRLVVELYSPKFPDLAALVPTAETYFKVVLRVGNLTDVSAAGVENIMPKKVIKCRWINSNDELLPMK